MADAFCDRIPATIAEWIQRTDDMIEEAYSEVCFRFVCLSN